jgi:type III secretory pathway lipoprotein EscJ
MLFRVASAPSYTTLQAGVDPAKTGKITAALDQAGVSYKLENNGTAIAVVSGQESKARVALAGQGLSTSGSQPGYELLDKQKLGSSTFQQQIAYQRALEGQIAQTIGQIDGISGAQVQLTLPKDDLFADEKQPATAAVLLNADSTAVDPAAIRGIASLVSSSVPNLKPSNVTITDASGSMLWPQDGAGDAGGTASKPAAEARYAAGMQSTLGALIARTVGSDKAQVQVHADLNVDQSTQEKLAYAKKGTPLHQVKETESLKGTGGSTGGWEAFGVQVLPAELKAPDALDDVFTELAAQRPDTLQIMSDSGIFDLSDRIAALAQMHRIPSFATLPEYVGAGGLLAYGASRRRLFIRSGYYVKRILEGSLPGDLPVEQPTRFELSINVRTAKALDLVVPTTLLAQADEVVE